MAEKHRAIAMKPGVVAVGADNQRDTSLGSTERSYFGLKTGSVQLTDASLFGREQDPRGPKKMEGPSTLSLEGFGERSKEGFTTSKDTW